MRPRLWRSRAIGSAILLILLACGSLLRSDDPPKTDEDLVREKAIAEFTAKMKAANYPALFEKAAEEFKVPADVLKGIAFAETRWEHLTWPPGENYSPENGMPRPYGIMSLWSNEFFGHSLLEAAKLIGKDPEELKQDPFQNIRGAAALLKKIYDENPKPPGTQESDIESWRYAIVKYCGIPERDLSARHGLDVYEFMNQGYHQYGIEWDAHPVNLEPMRAEVKQIVAEERAKFEERMKNDPRLREEPGEPVATQAGNPPKEPNIKAAAPAPAIALPPKGTTDPPQVLSQRVLLLVVAIVLILLLLVGFVAYRRRYKPRNGLFSIMLILAVAVPANSSTDYGPAIWRPCCSTHLYYSGYGHKFLVIHDMEGYYLISGSGLMLSWEASTNRTYRIQYKDDLNATNWTSLPDILATNSVMSVPLGVEVFQP